MFKKFVALLLVAMLVLPATALAAGKPDFAAGKSESKAPEKAEKEAKETEDKNARPSQAGEGNTNKPSASTLASVDDEDQTGDTGQVRTKGEQARSEAKTNKDAKKAEVEALKAEKKELKETKKEELEALKAEKKELKELKKEEKEALKAEKKELKAQIKEEKKLRDLDSTKEDSETGRGKGIGITVAMNSILENIGKVGGNAVKALTNVYNKFASWLGLPSYEDVNEPGEVDEGDGLGSDEDTGTVEPDDGLGSDEDTDTPGLDDELGSGEETESVDNDTSS